MTTGLDSFCFFYLRRVTMKDFCKDFTNADPKEANEVVKSDNFVVN